MHKAFVLIFHPTVLRWKGAFASIPLHSLEGRPPCLLASEATELLGRHSAAFPAADADGDAVLPTLSP